MRVEFIQSLISNVSPYSAGDVADLDEATAIKYIQRGLCKPAPVQERAQARPQTEKAVHQPEVIENNDKPKRRSRRRNA